MGFLFDVDVTAVFGLKLKFSKVWLKDEPMLPLEGYV